MNQKDENNPVQQKGVNLERIEQRLDALDRQLDSIDSIVTALGERVMKHPLIVEITCPSCGQIIEISLMGTQRQRG